MTSTAGVVDEGTTTSHPLAASLAALDASDEWVEWRSAVPRDGRGWIRCADLQDRGLAEWEEEAAARQRVEHGRSDAITAAAYALEWYGLVPGSLGGLLYRSARRVPTLSADVLWVRQHAEEGWVDGVAWTGGRFWCLPADPAAAHPDARVVDDETALAAVLRAEVRQHADAFLATYRPGARLARRDLLGTFFDGLDGAAWDYEETDPARFGPMVEAARVVLPGRTPEFRDSSTLYVLDRHDGAPHLTRERISCCRHYRVAADARACFTCPRTTRAERRDRLVDG